MTINMKSGYKFESKRSPNGHARKYQMQYDNAKRCAKERNIDWQFTYDSWIEWWGADIVNRGPRKGQLVMARYNDAGPYHPDNVRKATTGENVKEAHTGKAKPSKRKGIPLPCKMSAEALRLRGLKIAATKAKQRKNMNNDKFISR